MMKPLPDSSCVWPWVRYFLETHLPKHRGASPNTVASYRGAFRLFLRFLRQRSGARARSIVLHELEPALILDFLFWLEDRKGRHVSASSRNCRLSALRSFFGFLELHRDREEATRWQRLRQVPFKKVLRTVVEHLEPCEIEFVLAEVPTHTADGFRDLTLLALLYNTGARASEIALARCSAVRLEALPAIRLLGKGRRERVVPLWRPVAQLLQRYLEHYRRSPRSGHADFLFINQRRAHLTRHGVGRIVEKYLGLAARTTPGLRLKKLSAHSFRHSTAIHLLRSGADINVIKAWLGHRTTTSTSRYLDLDLESHRGVLETFQPPSLLDKAAGTPGVSSSRPEDDLEHWLNTL
jgi:site-specific recombinase XerD